MSPTTWEPPSSPLVPPFRHRGWPRSPTDLKSVRKTYFTGGAWQGNGGRKPAPPGGGETIKRVACQYCGYVDDPEVGDPLGGIPPGTWFRELPDDWVCPECGEGPEQFVQER
ncbi:MAG: rubredoxin [Methanoregulaceae archaeon]